MKAYECILIVASAGLLIGWVTIKDGKYVGGINEKSYTITEKAQKSMTCQPALIDKTVSKLMAGESFRDVFPLVIPANSDSMQYDLCKDVTYTLVDIIKQQKTIIAQLESKKRQ